MRYVIELGFETSNKPVPVIPLKESRRGRWRKRLAANSSQCAKLPDEIPGCRVALDTDKRSVFIYDASEDMAGRDNVDAEWARVFNAHYGVQAEIHLQNLTDAELVVWKDWMDAAVAYNAASVFTNNEGADGHRKPA